MFLLAVVVADDYDDADPGDNDGFFFDYDLDNDGVFDNDDTSQGEGYICMTLTDTWFPCEENEWRDDNVILLPGVFDIGGNQSIHPDFFNCTLNDSFGHPYINDDTISNTQVLHNTLLKSPMRIKIGNIDNSIEHYDALRCKFERIGIHASTNYFHFDSNKFLQLLLSSFGPPLIYQSTNGTINLELFSGSRFNGLIILVTSLKKFVISILTCTYSDFLQLVYL